MRSIYFIVMFFTMLSTLVACSGIAPETGEKPVAEAETSLRALLASDSRPAKDRARDAGRKPADIVEFLGIEPGMSVIDVLAAGGYYTEVLSLAVGANGRVISQNPFYVLQFRDGANDKALSARLANNRLPNVTRVNGDLDTISTADGQFDAALTALNFHDIYNGRGPEVALAALQAIYRALKPGGVFGIIDHVGVAGADNTALHRIEPSMAIATATAAGFVLETQSKLLAHPADDHTQRIFNKSIRGKTDRFVLKLRKPTE